MNYNILEHLLVVGVPSAGHVELSIIVQCSDVIWVEGVEDAVVAVSSYSHWRAVKVDEFCVRVVGVSYGSSVNDAACVVDNVRVVSPAADVVSIAFIVFNEATVVVEVATHELAAEVCRVRSGKVADAVESLIRSCDVDSCSSIGIECSVARRSCDIVSSLLVGSVAGSIVRVSKVASLLISLDHHRTRFDGNSDCAACLFFLLMVSAGAATTEAKSDVSTVLVAAASPVGPKEVAAIALD